MYKHEPHEYDCPLCRIANAQFGPDLTTSEDELVYRTDQVISVISTHQWPNNPGNVIVFPIEHFENIFDLPLSLASSVHDLARGIALAMKEAWRCDGISTRQHNGHAGNQDVWHFHLHVTPRYEGDDLYATYASSAAVMPPVQRMSYAAQLRRAMTSWRPLNLPGT